MKRLLKNISLLAFFVLLFGVISLGVGVAATLISPGPIDDVKFMLIYFVSMVLTYLAATLLERVAYKYVMPIENSRAGFDPVALLAGVVLLIAISIVLAPLGEVLPSDSRTFPEGPFTLVSVVVLAPIFEEMIFRGRLYNMFKRNGSPLISASFSALAFGIVHLEPIVVVEALIAGVVFSYFYLVKRSIFTPIILHMCSNAIAYALIVLSYRGEPLVAIGGDEDKALVVYIVSVIIVLVGVVVILRTFNKISRAGKGVVYQEVSADMSNEAPADAIADDE